MTDGSKSIDFEWRNGHQYYAAIAANLIMLAYGNQIGWFSPALPTLLSESTPLDTGVLTSYDVSWLGSITNMGAMCGTFTFGFITSCLGCKRAMIFLTLPSFVFCTLVYFGYAYHHILVARFFTGLIGGGVTTIVLYISEIANNNIRGRLGSFVQLSRNTGILIAYIIGATVDYKYIPCIYICIPLLFVVCFGLLPNTPQYYLHRNRIQKAEDALKYYKSYEGKTKVELNAFNVEFERLKSIAKEQQTDQRLHISDFTNRKAIKGMAVGILLSYFTQLTGCITIITYAVYILKRTGTTLDPYNASIAIALMLILGNLCSTHLADKFSRKCFLLLSMLAAAAGLTGLSLLLYLGQNGYNFSKVTWLPVAFLAFVVFIVSAGDPITHVCRVENLPTKIRTVGMTISISFLYASSFMCTKLFPLLVERVGLHGCMMIFAINTIFGVFFIYFMVDETRGQPMDTLQSEENNNKTSKLTFKYC